MFENNLLRAIRSLRQEYYLVGRVVNHVCRDVCERIDDGPGHVAVLQSTAIPLLQ